MENNLKIVSNVAVARVGGNRQEQVAPRKAELAGMIEQKIQAHRDAVNDFFNAKNNVQLIELSGLCCRALTNGNKIMFCGNGGSAADAQHIATEFTVRFVKDRKALAAISLTTDTSAITAIANDFGYEYIFSRQVEALGQAGDILLAISTSGNSVNIINAVKQANKQGIHTVTLSGKNGGEVKDMAKYDFIVPHQETARIQECHITFLHLLCGLVEAEMGLG